MSSGKHTAGPWKVVGQRTHGPSTGARDITQTMIAVPHKNGPWEVIGVRSGNEEADAHLIAAAPDLLEACEAVAEDVCSSLCPSKWRTDSGQPHSAQCGQLRAAIKKARGE